MDTKKEHSFWFIFMAT